MQGGVSHDKKYALVVDLLRKKLQILKSKLVICRGAKVHHGRVSWTVKTEIEAGKRRAEKHNDIRKDYKLSKEILGKGSFGSVRVCIDRKTGARFACKTILKSSMEEDAFVHQEREILKYLSGSHPGIVNLKDFYEDSKSFYLVMELCTGGQLEEGRVTEHDAANWMKGIMSALKYCHAMGVVHRDLKPQNILFTESGTVKLVDFGLATRISRDEKLFVRVGTPQYVAPEILNFKNYSDKVDVWSAGVILYNLLSGTKPFHGKSFEAVTEVIMKTELDFDTACWNGVTPEARDLVSKMLCKDVSSRLTAGQVLNHPWISIHNNKKQSSKN
ncbi:non-specific serine/threonine protein kinase [Ranunculus cassubicifolius]